MPTKAPSQPKVPAKIPADTLEPKLRGVPHSRSDRRYTVEEAAEIMVRPRRSVYDLLNSRRLGHLVIGGKKYVLQSHIDALWARSERKAVK